MRTRNSVTNLTPGFLFQSIFENKNYRFSKLSKEQKSIKLQQIKQAFNGITSNENPQLALAFRLALRTLKANGLENVLYANSEDIIYEENIPKLLQLPNETSIKKMFVKINIEYKYFTEINYKLAEKHFINLFYRCKLIADYIEFNTHDIYLNAYKIAVLFSIPKKHEKPFMHIDAYIKKFFSNSNQPLFEAITTVNLPPNVPPLKDLEGWRQLISKYGKKAIQIFQLAAKIEDMHEGRAPLNLIEARQAITKLGYKRYEEYPELALLCKHFGYEEHVFERCLAIEKTRKQSDNLPAIHLDGDVVGHSGYHLLKLPIDDPHAYILGELSNCCMYVGNHSGEKCIISGLTYKNNAFYVLLKGNPNHSPIIDGKIDYRHFKIVGQAYTWLSKTGNLTFDSWDNLRTEDNKVICDMLPKFAEQITNAIPSALRVTIGNGSKTPHELKQHPVDAESNEKILEGVQYMDSTFQSLIYFNKEKLLKLQQNFIMRWDNLAKKPLAMSGVEFIQFIHFNEIYNFDQLKTIENLFFREDSYNSWQALINDKSLIAELQDKISFDMLTILAYLKQYNTLNLVHINGIITHDKPKSLSHAIVIINFLQENNYSLPDKLFKTFLSNTNEEIKKIHLGLQILFNEKLQDKIEIILKNPQHAFELSIQMASLHKAGVLKQSLNILLDNIDWVENIGTGIAALQQKSLFNNFTVDFILTQPQHAYHLASCLISLNKAKLADSHLHIIPSILRALPSPGIFPAALQLLKRSTLLTDENFQLLITRPTLSFGLACIIRILHNEHFEKQLNKKTLDILTSRSASYEEFWQFHRVFNACEDQFFIDYKNEIKTIFSEAKNVQSLINGLNKLNFISELKNWISLTPKTETQGFFNRFKSQQDPKAPAEKLLHALQCKKVIFNREDLEVLLFKTSKLSDLVLKYKMLGVELPDEIIAAHSQLKEDMKHKYHKFL